MDQVIVGYKDIRREKWVTMTRVFSRRTHYEKRKSSECRTNQDERRRFRNGRTKVVNFDEAIT